MSTTVTIGDGVTANITRLTVERAGHEVVLTRQTFAIFLAVASAKHGITPERLFVELFGADPNGGPLSGTKAIMVQRTNLNTRLQPLGITVRSRGAGRAALYELSTAT